MDELINNLNVRTRANQKLIKFDTEDKSKNLRSSMYEVDFT